MPITSCPIHGESGIVEMCRHLYDDLKDGVYTEFFELPVFTTRMCRGCADQHDIPRVQVALHRVLDRDEVAQRRDSQEGAWAIAPDIHFESAILQDKSPELLERLRLIYRDVAQTRGWKCTSCIDQIQLDEARRLGRPLPFEPFEDVVMDEETAAQIESQLNDRLKARNEATPRRERTHCMVRSGAAPRTPLTIEVYGVEDEEAQQSVLQLIEDIFLEIDQKQRTIQFYTSAKWARQDNGVRRFTRGPLLLDVLVR